MTKKRFMLDDAGELIDLNNHKFVDYGEECCNLLNKLAEENEQLKSILKEMVRVSEYNGAISPMRVKSMVYNFIGDLK